MKGVFRVFHTSSHCWFCIYKYLTIRVCVCVWICYIQLPRTQLSRCYIRIIPSQQGRPKCIKMVSLSKGS